MVSWILLSLPFCVLLLLLALAPQWIPAHWEKRYIRYIVTLVTLSVGATTIFYPEHAPHFLDTFLWEYLPFVMCLGCLYSLSCGIKVRMHAPATPLWNTVVLILGMLTASVLGTTGACVIWTHALLHLNRNRSYVLHTLVFLIIVVGNLGGMFSSLGDPPLLLGFLKGLPFLWPTQHLTLPGMYVSTILLSVYYVLDQYYIRKEKVLSWKGPVRIQVKGMQYIFAVFMFLVSIVSIQKYSTHVWTYQGRTISSADVYKLMLLTAVLGRAIRKVRYFPRFSLHILQEIGWIFFGLFMCVIPVVHWIHTPELYPWIQSCVQTNLSALFWIVGTASAFLDNAPTYLLFVEMLGGFNAISLAALKHVAYASVAMGAMTYIGNAPNLLVKSIAERAKITMPSFLGYMAWTSVILLPILMTLIYGTGILYRSSA
jgi:Na+/H+ antiporter NhaD/arsenite permease-like protein